MSLKSDGSVRQHPQGTLAQAILNCPPTFREGILNPILKVGRSYQRGLSLDVVESFAFAHENCCESVCVCVWITARDTTPHIIALRFRELQVIQLLRTYPVHSGWMVRNVAVPCP